MSPDPFKIKGVRTHCLGKPMSPDPFGVAAEYELVYTMVVRRRVGPCARTCGRPDHVDSRLAGTRGSRGRGRRCAIIPRADPCNT